MDNFGKAVVAVVLAATLAFIAIRAVEFVRASAFKEVPTENPTVGSEGHVQQAN